MSSTWILPTMICLNFTLAANALTAVMSSIKEHAVQTEEKRPSQTADRGVVLYFEDERVVL